MQESTIIITSESIVDLAQNTLIPSGIKCEWVTGGRNPCPAVLGCWNALKKVCGKLDKQIISVLELTDRNCAALSLSCQSFKTTGMYVQKYKSCVVTSPFLEV